MLAALPTPRSIFEPSKGSWTNTAWRNPSVEQALQALEAVSAVESAERQFKRRRTNLEERMTTYALVDRLSNAEKAVALAGSPQ